MQTDFIKLYCNELMPLLYGLENQRKKLCLINTIFQLLSILIITTLFICIVLSCIIPEKMSLIQLSAIEIGILIFLLPVVIILLAYIADRIMTLIKNLTLKAKKVYFENILKTFGENINYTNYPNTLDIDVNSLHDKIDKINDSDLFPQFTHLNITDEIKGTYNKTRFSLMLLELFFSGRIVCIGPPFFKGILLKFKTKRKMKEDIYICSKGEYLGISPWIIATFITLSIFCLVPILIAAYISQDTIFIKVISFLLLSLFIVGFLIFSNIKKFKKIKINDKNLAKQYSLFVDEYSDGDIDQVELFNDDMLEIFNNIQKVYKTNKIKLTWSENNIILAINTNKKIFEFESGSKSFIDSEVISDCNNKLSIIFNIIDTLNKK